MICVMSVMNGFEKLVEGMFSEFDPELLITAKTGKYFYTNTDEIEALRALPYVQAISEQIEETALIQYNDHRTPATLLGVDEHFQDITHIDSILIDGLYSVYDGYFERVVMGRGLAIAMGVNATFHSGIHIFAPRRTERVNMLRPDESFREESVFMAGVFAVNQLRYDDATMIVSLPLTRRLFEYDDNVVTRLGLKLQEGDLRRYKTEIQDLLGEDYLVADRYEQQADFFRIVRIEKLLTVLLLVFILLIAGFNVISSLSMLILDKEEDIHILSSLGADKAQIQRIFRLEGWMISSIGAIIGMLIGVTICLLQQHFGLLKLGTGTEYVISAYPVAVKAADILIVMTIVLGLGWIAALGPSRRVKA